MALDEALLTRARRSGENVLRVYTWAMPTLSLGRNQRARGVYDPHRAEERGIGIVRRITGGRALLHHREVTYSVTGPAAHGGSLRTSFDAINRMLLRALQGLGVRAQLASPRQRTPAPASAPCFEAPSLGEIVFQNRKLVGSAQRRGEEAFLQHGSILVEDDQPLIGCLANQPVASIPSAATLHEAMGRAPTVGEVADALFASAREMEDPTARDLEIDDELRRDARAALARYESDGWTWRQ
jgi:lipoate-protein ligase A